MNMRCKLFAQLFFAALVATCAAAAVVPVHAQEEPQQQPPSQEEGVTTRGAFLTTRQKAANRESTQTSGKAAGSVTTTAKKPDPPTIASNAPAAKKSDAKSSNKAKKNAGKSTNANSKNEVAGGGMKNSGGIVVPAVAYKEAALRSRPIGLGYTLFTLGDNGEAVRTNPARQFRTGEAIRISLESNTDGYLYIFHTENDGKPSMIFPDVRLNGGNNLVSAHVPYEIPSSQAASEELRWFVFKDPPAEERLYVILTRQPLAGVPTGATLADFCLNKVNVCPWRPATAVWTEIKAAQGREQVAVSKVKDEGRAQTSDERDATSRGLGLAIGAPQPSIIRMTASANSTMLVTAIDLIHK